MAGAGALPIEGMGGGAAGGGATNRPGKKRGRYHQWWVATAAGPKALPAVESRRLVGGWGWQPGRGAALGGRRVGGATNWTEVWEALTMEGVGGG